MAGFLKVHELVKVVGVIRNICVMAGVVQIYERDRMDGDIGNI